MAHDSAFDGRINDATLQKAFEAIEPQLAAFADRHSLFIRKYIHNCAMWGFYCFHPNGGKASVTLAVMHQGVADFKSTVTGEWHVDDQATRIRTTFSVPLERLSSASFDVIGPAFESVLVRLLVAPAASRSKTTPNVGRPVDSTGKPLISDLDRLLRVAT